MTTLLHLDASVGGESSLSRRLSQTFVEAWILRAPETRVLRRDLAATPPPFVDQSWIAAAGTKLAARTAAMNDVLAISDELIREVEKADVIVLGTPMYNYGMPARLKAWVDQVVRVDRTFSFSLARGDFPLEPLLSGKTLVLLTSAGEFGFEPGGPRSGMNHLVPHIATLHGFLGVGDAYEIAIEYEEFGDERHQLSIAAAASGIPDLVNTVADRIGARAAAVPAAGASSR